MVTWADATLKGCEMSKGCTISKLTISNGTLKSKVNYASLKHEVSTKEAQCSILALIMVSDVLATSGGQCPDVQMNVGRPQGEGQTFAKSLSRQSSAALRCNGVHLSAQYADAGAYTTKFRQLQGRALGAVRNKVQQVFRHATQQ
eukprot:scaffold289839_cov23-Tisochrysis_lutea.AAC.1